LLQISDKFYSDLSPKRNTDISLRSKNLKFYQENKARRVEFKSNVKAQVANCWVEESRKMASKCALRPQRPPDFH
jgi:hypothetical protein